MTISHRAGEPAGRFGLLQLTIVLAAVATAAIHIGLAFQFANGVDPVFLLNGFGYLGLTALLFAPFAVLDRYRNLLRWVLIAYTLVTLLAWVFVGVRSTVAYVDKAIEVLLIICLWLDWLQARSRRV
jgi:cellulose synthase/poly-beta-1,6-N-acetylglucosamine synthase-like glycosyltransferase